MISPQPSNMKKNENQTIGELRLDNATHRGADILMSEVPAILRTVVRLDRSRLDAEESQQHQETEDPHLNLYLSWIRNG